MYWTDGSIYQGEWARGIQHGLGKMLFPGGSVKEGAFEFNVFKGPVATTGGEVRANSMVGVGGPI